MILCHIVFLATLRSVWAVPGIVETVAGGGKPHEGKPDECNDINNSRDGVGEQARFNYPWGIAYDHFQNYVYVADCGCIESEHPTDKIRRIDLKTQEVKTIAGSTQGFSDGFGPNAHFKHVAGITIDPELEMLYIADSGNHRIRLMYLANARVVTIAGLPAAGFVDQTTISSQFNNPQSIALHRTGDGERILYIADTDNHAIRVIHLRTDDTGDVKTLAGGVKGFKDGVKLDAQFYHPAEIVIDGVGKYMYIADHFNHAIRRLELETGQVTTLSQGGYSSDLGPDSKPKHLVFHFPEGLVYDPDYGILYVTEFNNHDILAVLDGGSVKTLAGKTKGKKGGVGVVARFNHPSGLSFDRKTRTLFVADQYNHLLRTVSAFGSTKKYLPKKKTSSTHRGVGGGAGGGGITQKGLYMNVYVYGIAVLVLVLLVFLIKPVLRYFFKVSGAKIEKC